METIADLLSQKIKTKSTKFIFKHIYLNIKNNRRLYVCELTFYKKWFEIADGKWTTV
jgi:hypothetical protein